MLCILYGYLLSGITILRDGVVPVNVGDFRERLMPIRLGEVSWEDVNVWRLELHKEFDLAFEKHQAAGSA